MRTRGAPERTLNWRTKEVGRNVRPRFSKCGAKSIISKMLPSSDVSLVLKIAVLGS